MRLIYLPIIIRASELPPINFPQSEPLTADGIGKIGIPYSTTLDYLSCDTTSADIAFSAALLAQRIIGSNENATSETLEVMLYPSPSDGNIHIRLKGLKEVDSSPVIVTVFDLTGRSAYIKQYNSVNLITINLTELLSGICSVHVTMDGIEVVKKMVIK